MARPPRIDYPGAIQHVINRGADRQDTFRNDLDRELLTTIWAEAVSRFGIEVICFCWMRNHFHVVVRSTEGQLSRAMQHVGRSYTQQFNHFHGRDGALFRGRFHSTLVDSQSYFDQLTKYVHRNPVEAGVVTIDALRSYPWSSYGYYIGDHPAPNWISVQRGLESFRDADSYRRFVEDQGPTGDVHRLLSQGLRPGQVLGAQSFIDDVATEFGPEAVRGAKPGVGRASLDEIDRTILEISGSKPRALYAGEGDAASRWVAALVARDMGLATVETIAERYGFVSASSVHSALFRARTRSADLHRNVLDALPAD